jgi:UDP-N-acetylmuramoylalanine--D-glutamate ligase
MKKHQYQGKNVLVLGLAKSGEAAARLLHKLGATVTVNDAKPYDENHQAQQLEQLGIHVICGHHPLSLLDKGFVMIVKNPGIPYSNPIVNEALNRGISIITEVELASEISEAEFVAITGSNGKTTTTTLIYEMLKKSEREPLIAGNIGTVACEVAENATEQNVIVLEVSSFQLLGTEKFKPKVSVFLNIFDAHLDYHGTRNEYVSAKTKITTNQAIDDYLVYNDDDDDVAKVASISGATLIPFSVSKTLQKGLCIKDGAICFDGQPLVPLNIIVLPGKHNLENILAAIGAAITMGAELSQIEHVLKTFTGVEHRLQFIKELEGRRFYNDSKATNILASQKALEAFEQPIVLLAGGLDRGNEFDDLAPFLTNVKALVTFGQTKEKLEKVAKNAGVDTIIYAENMDEAVSYAYDQTSPGDVVLLSPACASWDQYKTFEERGKRFVEAIESLTP